MNDKYAAPDGDATVLVASGDPARSSRRCGELTLAGYVTIHVEDVMEALTVIRSRNPSMVLLLPPLSGLPGTDLPNIMREAAPYTYLPVLVQADGLGRGGRCEYLRQGADDVISSETSMDEMIARAQSLMRVRELHDQLSASRSALQTSLDRERKLMAKLKKDNADLQQLCATDPLTRLQNGRSFWEILAHELKMARRYNQPLSLLMLDVDHFKLVNDNYGHPSGDYVLKELAVILKRSVRESDVVARTGGEEFSVILPKADLRRCAVLAQRIKREAAAREFAVYGRRINVTISIGTATYPADAEITEERMMAYLADRALLSAKAGGRDRVVALHELEIADRARMRRQYFEARAAQEEIACSQASPRAEQDSPSLT
jgi:two-component system cell cycle response regulator